MKLTKYVAPVSPLDAVFDRLGFGVPGIDRYFGDAGGTADEAWTAVRIPRTNVSETEDSFVLQMEMPGLTREHVEVNVEGDTLVVRGEKMETSEEKGLVRREFRSTRFERTFNVGNAIDRERVKAKMENGILTVTIPKSPEKVGRKIDVA